MKVSGRHVKEEESAGKKTRQTLPSTFWPAGGMAIDIRSFY
jgi:hypothetical protein